eukprot:SAG22_NODE_214_length_15003_cov_18.466519_15_plen_69_part_00
MQDNTVSLLQRSPLKQQCRRGMERDVHENDSTDTAHLPVGERQTGRVHRRVAVPPEVEPEPGLPASQP